MAIFPTGRVRNILVKYTSEGLSEVLFAFLQEFSYPKTVNSILFATKVNSRFWFESVKFYCFHIHIYTYIDLHFYTLAALYDNNSHLSTKYDNEFILEI